MHTLPFLPDNDTLALATLNAQKGDTAVVGRFRDSGGEVIIFSDMDAANAYAAHVGLSEVSSFPHVLTYEEDNAEVSVTVHIAFGRK